MRRSSGADRGTLPIPWERSRVAPTMCAGRDVAGTSVDRDQLARDLLAPPGRLGELRPGPLTPAGQRRSSQAEPGETHAEDHPPGGTETQAQPDQRYRGRSRARPHAEPSQALILPWRGGRTHPEVQGK